MKLPTDATLVDTTKASEVCSSSAAIENKVPKVIHFIWLGSQSIPFRYVWNILSCFEKNGRNYEINLWVNPESFSPDIAKCSRYVFLEKQGVFLRNYRDLKIFRDKEFVSLCDIVEKVHLRCPVVASDILRWAILAENGGIYYDTDTQFRKPLPVESIHFVPKTTLIIDITRSRSSGANEFCNSFLAAMPDAEEVSRVLGKLNYLSSSCDADYFFKLDREGVIATTGPGILEFAPSEERFSLWNYSRKEYPQLDGTKSHAFDGSWSEPTEDHRKKLITHNVQAGIGIILWKSGKLDRTKLDATLAPDTRDDDIAGGDCCIM